jgi:hypothetical protein
MQRPKRVRRNSRSAVDGVHTSSIHTDIVAQLALHAAPTHKIAKLSLAAVRTTTSSTTTAT